MKYVVVSHIYRDKWTQLNVTAAKIMQQSHILAEIKEYFENHRNDKRLMNTIQHLDACNKLFERGLLSLEKKSVKKRSVIELMEDIFFVFCWLV